MSSVPELRLELVWGGTRKDGCCLMRRWPSRSRALALCVIELARSPSFPQGPDSACDPAEPSHKKCSVVVPSMYRSVLFTIHGWNPGQGRHRYRHQHHGFRCVMSDKDWGLAQTKPEPRIGRTR